MLRGSVRLMLCVREMVRAISCVEVQEGYRQSPMARPISLFLPLIS